jgi:hypothetical protein
MKTRIGIAIASLFVCLLTAMDPPLLQDIWGNWDSLAPRANFYFKKRQWLADGRTIAAAIHYLYESSKADLTDSISAATVPEGLAQAPQFSSEPGAPLRPVVYWRSRTGAEPPRWL